MRGTAGLGTAGALVGVRAAGARLRAAAALAVPVAALALAVLALAGCGNEVELADLFVVQRTGSGPGADLTMVVNEGGAVHCYPSPAVPTNPTHQLSDPQLVLARGLQEEMQSLASKHLSLGPRRGSVFSYYVRDPEGTVRFSDNSSGQPKVLQRLAYFVLEVSQSVCHLST